MEQPLRARVEQFIYSGINPTDMHNILHECITKNDLEGMMYVRQLFENNYDGYTDNLWMKGHAAYAMLCWGRIGIDCLVEAALATPSPKNISLCAEVLAVVAAQAPIKRSALVWDDELVQRICKVVFENSEHVKYCRSKLAELILSIEEVFDISLLMSSTIVTASMRFDDVAREIFCAISSRMLAVSKPVIKHFEKLITDNKHDEDVFQNYLTKYPQLLDPMAVQVWPKPDLRGAKEPDFVVRRVDNSYLVVEIEKPSKVLVTLRNQLSSDATQAEKQAADYKTFLMRRFQSACEYFPNFDEPDCLVVIGLEDELNVLQKEVLANANRQRTRLRIAGFDWLARRAATITENMIQSDIEVMRLRMV